MKVLDQCFGNYWNSYNCDTVEFTAEMPANTIDMSVYSPPFSNLYVYSESERDMGNVDNDAMFFESYKPLVKDLFRITKPGRLTAIHIKDLVYYSNSSDKGDRGLKPFLADCIKAHIDAGWTYHRLVTIWRCPVKEMQKTKADRLLFKHFRQDAARTGGGLPEYLAVFRKWAPGMDETAPVVHDPKQFPVDVWQEWASPVWMSMRETDVLNATVARSADAERHLCPMPLDITKRALLQYSNPRETIYSPFMGIGSEGYASLQQGRRFIGTELNPTYFHQANKFLAEAESIGQESNSFDFTVAAE
jgi:DNA modification methylase